MSKQNGNVTSIEDHRRKTISGLKWSGVGQVIKQVLNISIGILLARLLSPKEFGLLGMVTVITGFMQLFNDFGFGAALIQKENVDELDYNSVFWFNLATGFVFFILVFLLSPIVANFYHTPEVELILKYLGSIFIIQSLNYVHQTKLKKQLNFKVLFKVELISLLISGASALVLAYTGFGIISLIAQLLVNSLVSAFLLWFYSNWRPAFIFSKEKIKGMLGYSLPLMGSGALGYLLGNFDKLLIGRYLGTISLGLYSRAYSLMVFPVGQISGVISQVMFPSFAQIQDDKERMKVIYLKMTRTISFITFPMMCLAFFLAEPFVILVLGEQWREMINLFRVLTVVGALQSIGTLIGNIFMALGEMKLYLKLNFYSGLVFVIASIIGVNFGVNGVVVALVLATITVGIPQWKIAGDLVHINLKTYVGSWLMNAICALIALGFSIFLTVLLGFQQYFELFILSILFCLEYLTLVYFLNRNMVTEIRLIINKKNG